jgi:glc operon protein GlcG
MTLSTIFTRCGAALGLLCMAGLAQAQTLPYGAPIDLGTAKKIAAAAVAEAAKINVPEAVAISDAAGDLVYFEKMDSAQTGGVKVAQGKARSAALYRRPTKVWEDIVASGGGGLRILGLEGAVPIEGGLPIVIGGKIVGAIGVSGGSAPQDGQVAKAGLAALN